MPAPDNDRDYEDRILASWAHNAAAWTTLVRTNAIGSRVRITNAAILDAIRLLAPTRVIDIGCGEGWLTHALASQGVDAVGIDAEPVLIAQASCGPGRFEVVGYAELQRFLAVEPNWDMAVCNFSLLAEDLAPVLAPLRDALRPSGHLLIQTVSPCSQPDGERGGWRVEHFDAFAADMATMPWYYRTASGWAATLQALGFAIVETLEPRDPATGRPASLLMIATSSG